MGRRLSDCNLPNTTNCDTFIYTKEVAASCLEIRIKASLSSTEPRQRNPKLIPLALWKQFKEGNQHNQDYLPSRHTPRLSSLDLFSSTTSKDSSSILPTFHAQQLKFLLSVWFLLLLISVFRVLEI
jgi:hypothetical protein